MGMAAAGFPEMAAGIKEMGLSRVLIVHHYDGCHCSTVTIAVPIAVIIRFIRITF